MFLHYLKIATRNLLKNKTQSIISIIGLAVSFVCISLSAIWIRYETTYDTSHPNAENIYCVLRLYENNSYNYSVLFGNEVEMLQNTYPEIKSSVNVCMISSISIQNNEGKTVECYGSDASVFEIFSPQFILGSKETALNKPYSLVLNESTAKNLFGSVDKAMGQTVKSVSFFENNSDYTVTAIIKDVKHSNVKLNATIPYTENERNEWNNNNIFLAYVLLNNNINKEQLFSKLAKPNKDGIYYKLAPIAHVQYKYDGYYGLQRALPFNYKYIIVLVLISLLLFICALFNHISLFMSFTYTRLRDLGLRKVTGASSRQLYLLLLTEFIFSLLIAFVIAVCFIEILRPTLERLTDITVNIYQMLGIISIFAVSGVVLSVILISYPIWRVCTYSIKQNMTGKKSFKQQNTQKFLISIQLIISIFFLFITSTMYYQINFINTKDLGINIKNVVKISPSRNYSSIFKTRADVIVNDLLKEHEITDAFKQTRDFFLENGNKNFQSKHIDWEGKDANFEDFSGTWIESSPHLAHFFDIQVIDGRFFSKNSISDSSKIVINEQLAKIIGNPIGKSIKYRDSDLEIIGVIENIQDRSLKYESRPMILEFSNFGSFIYTRYVPGKVNEAQAAILTVMKKHGVDDYNIEFMEDKFKSFTKADTIMMQIISIVALVCLLISIAGIYSLTLYSMARRRREVAIRKVMGADVKTIIRMFFKEYLGLVAIASIVAIPPAYYIINKWLQNYAHRINITWWLIAVIIFFVLLVVVITVLRQIVKAANSNPADVIKYE